jgi:hypothetical protein
MCGAVPPLPNTPSLCGAQLKGTGTTLPLPYITGIIMYSLGQLKTSRDKAVISYNEKKARQTCWRNGHLEQFTVHSGTHWASVYQSLNYLADMLCQPVNICLLNVYFILLTD